jgi:transcriptional regulator with XRE-family HTH domain
MNSKIAEKLKKLRKQKGWSQVEVAERLDISPSAYSRMEAGESCSWASKLEDICQLYEIEADELFKDTKTIINNNQQGGQFNVAETINQLSDKLIEQMESRLKEKDEIIKELRERLEALSSKVEAQ